MSELDTFDHIVVLMMENRSFDNMLGHLYGPADVPGGQSFEGVAGKNLSNPIPADARESERKIVPVQLGYVMDNPNPDPGEEYPHVNTQLFGTVAPDTNRYKNALVMAAPFNAPPPDHSVPTMDGFVTDYINNFHVLTGRAPTYEEYSVIMECYAPETVPVLSSLAKQFAVCDHWHCSVPSQTFTNRSFLHAASSSGAVVNAPYSHWPSTNTAETIFERIESLKDHGLSWKIYFDRADVFPLTGLIHYARLERYLNSHCCYMEQFFEDARTGTLPSYAFIEPRLFLDHSDQHPPVRVHGELISSSVLAGELLIHQVYDAVRLSDTPGGSNYQNTLLIITYDEHGGCYDHVPPPEAPSPDATGPQGQMGFTFDRLGVRVPAVLVSACIEPGTVVNTTFDHTSVIKTMSKKWGLGNLTNRDHSAADLSGVFNRSTPRRREDWPVITPRELPAERASNRHHLLNDLQRAIIAVANAIGGDPGTPLSETMQVFEALEHMKRMMGSKTFCG